MISCYGRLFANKLWNKLQVRETAFAESSGSSPNARRSRSPGRSLILRSYETWCRHISFFKINVLAVNLTLDPCLLIRI
jgi:hypothetical protein